LTPWSGKTHRYPDTLAFQRAAVPGVFVALPRLAIVVLSLSGLPGHAKVKEEVSLARVTPVPADQTIPALDFLRPHLFEEPTLNPTGTRFAAFIENQHFTQNVLVCEISSGKFEWTDNEMDVVGFRWMNDTEIMLDSPWGIARRGMRTDWVGGQSTIREVGNLDKVKAMFDYRNRNTYGVIDGTDRILTDRLPGSWPDGYARSYWVRPENGKLDFTVINDEGHLLLYLFDGKKFVKSPVDPTVVEPIDVGTKPGQMLALGPRQEGKPRAIQYVDVATGALGEVVYQDSQYEGYPVLFHRPGSCALIGLSVEHSIARPTWFDPKRQRVQQMIAHFFPRSSGIIEAVDRTETKFLVKEISDIKPPSHYLLDLEKKSIGLLKNECPWIDPARMAPMQVMAYKARDGRLIEGFLTLPAGTSKSHPAPLIVLPHGGPWLRDTWGWRGDVQFLASRGYAVFQPNYRGSDGYDWRFDATDRWDFSKMHADVTDGTRALIKTGMVDPSRIAIMGFGFGGYLAIRGATDEPDLYRCALTIGGVFDWKKAVSAPYMENDPQMYQVRQHMAAFPSPEAKYAEISVMARASSIKIPIFITNNIGNRGSADIATRQPETFELSRAIPHSVDKVVFGDLHLDSNDDAFIDLVERFEKIEAFLSTHLAPISPAASH
jgi:pimeloyl-ACP methyl ester carboxylesterase